MCKCMHVQVGEYIFIKKCVFCIYVYVSIFRIELHRYVSTPRECPPRH